MSALVVVPVAAVGALAFLHTRRSGALRSFVQEPTEGATRALGALPAEVAGVPVVRASSGSPLDTLHAHQLALASAHGSVGGTAWPVPKMQVSELLTLVDGWLDAYEAGRDASADTARDFALVNVPFPAWVQASALDWQRAREGRASLYPESQTDLGRYLFELTAWRERELRGVSDDADEGGFWGDVGADAQTARQATRAQVVGTFDRLRRFVGAIEGVSYVFPWARPSDQNPLLHVPGAVGAAASATGDAAISGAKSILGLAGDAVLAVFRNPLLYVGGAVLVGGGVYLAVKHAR